MVIGNRAVAVDGGMLKTANQVLDYLNKNQLHLDYILLTHSHFDHVMGLSRLRTSAKTKVVAHNRSKRGDLKLGDGENLEAIGNQLSFLVIYTGIHKADHVWYFERNNRILFVGDYLPTSKELEVLRNRHDIEPNVILPGHGKPETIS